MRQLQNFLLKSIFLGLSAGHAVADVGAGIASLEAGNLSEAAEQFKIAYEAGEGDGAFYLGRIFELGLGTEVDITRASGLYAAAVEQGSILAQVRLANMYVEGTELLRDYAEAARLFCDAADAGDQIAQLSCGLMYRQGRGVAQNYESSIHYLSLASEQGNVAAQNVLGEIYSTGELGSADSAMALQYYEKAAEQGNALAFTEASKIILLENTQEAQIQAYSYLTLAAVRQYEEAYQLREQLEQGMSEDAILKGQSAARKWTESKLATVIKQSASDE